MRVRKKYFARPTFSAALELRRSPTSTTSALLTLLILLMLPLASEAQYTFTTNCGKITLTGYTGPGGVVKLPSHINGRPVTAIGDAAFFGLSQLTNVCLPASIQSVGFSAFAACDNLTNATIGHCVTNLGHDAFRGCPQLKSINVSASNRKFSSVNGVLFTKAKTTLLQIPAGKSGQLNVPRSVTHIADYAAYECARLTGATFGTNVTSIGELAFANCTDLAGINLPNRLTRIGWEAFRWTGLTNVVIPDSVTNLGGFAFAGCAQLQSATLGNGVRTINKSTFENCAQLTQLKLGQGLTAIGDFAFASSGLTNLALPEGILNISAFAFNRCTNLTHVTIPNSVTNLGDGIGVTFARCTRLTSITIGSGVTDLGDATFLNCASLTEVFFQGNAPTYGSDLFTGATNAAVYYLPGTTGWGASFAGQPTALWQPSLRLSNGTEAQRGANNSFGFDINWARGTTVVVEACTNLAQPDWIPLRTNVLTHGTAYFSDPDSATLPTRIYRATMLRTAP